MKHVCIVYSGVQSRLWQGNAVLLIYVVHICTVERNSCGCQELINLSGRGKECINVDAFPTLTMPGDGNMTKIGLSFLSNFGSSIAIGNVMLSIPGQLRFLLLQHNRTRNSSKFSAFEARFCAQCVCGGRETL